MTDRLDEMHEEQKILQLEIFRNHKHTFFYNPERFEGSQLYDICSNLISEVVELQNETNWKYWKVPKPIDKKKIAEELADIEHFLIQMYIEMDIDPEIRYRNYIRKNGINLLRQRNKY